jgi:hypothetical protein
VLGDLLEPLAPDEMVRARAVADAPAQLRRVRVREPDGVVSACAEAPRDDALRV